MILNSVGNRFANNSRSNRTTMAINLLHKSINKSNSTRNRFIN